jgi:hypothetical protein
MSLLGHEVVEQVISGRGMNQWPVDAQLGMGILTKSPFPPIDRRKLPRTQYFLKTDLLLTGPVETHVTIFSRDINAWNVGFISPIPLPDRAKGVIQLVAPDGRSVAVGCRLRRCQAFDLGWFDCFAEFVQPQYPFENL